MVDFTLYRTVLALAPAEEQGYGAEADEAEPCRFGHGHDLEVHRDGDSLGNLDGRPDVGVEALDQAGVGVLVVRAQDRVDDAVQREVSAEIGIGVRQVLRRSQRGDIRRGFKQRAFTLAFAIVDVDNRHVSAFAEVLGAEVDGEGFPGERLECRG
jgi:hypothetical protein